MQITVTDADGQAFGLDLTRETEVESLKSIIAVELNIPPDRQRILVEGHPLRSAARTLGEAGIGEGAILLVLSEGTGAEATAAPHSIPQNISEQQLQQPSRPVLGNQQREQVSAVQHLDFSGIVVDGGRVSQFPAATTVPPSSTTLASPPLATALSPTAVTAPSAVGSATETAAQIQALIRQHAEAVVAAAKTDPASLGIMRAHNPLLGDAISSAIQERQEAANQATPDAQHLNQPGPAMKRVMDLLMVDFEKKKQAQEERMRRLAFIKRDPLSLESQQFLLEELQQERINENYSMAREHLPEGFGSVCMLYVGLEINGVRCKAFVDSGAQQSILSVEFAEKCALSSLIDTRFAGSAHGVGKAPIVGRVHVAPLKLGTKFCPCNFIVLEDKRVEMILGLDLLRRYQMILDFKKNVLIFDGKSPSSEFSATLTNLTLEVAKQKNGDSSLARAVLEEHSP
ncbi:protein DDI1 homolog 2 [Cyclospora cayetanensis]|uniref:Protein DDI1 homolog 2 n=1 Tax=Cyclospora cayetanensis TaxID=88456 RepID=A0A6P6RWP9_9EIME|nr:protein DDI1 homolog 2 [Cyclospora cayetanensis]